MRVNRPASMKAGSLALLVGILATGQATMTALAGGQEATAKATADNRDADREAIRKSAAEFTAAFEKGDPKAVAALWTETGEYHDDEGVSLVGRANIEKAYAEHFKSQPKGKTQVEILSIHFPSRDTAIEEGVMRNQAPGAALPTSTRYSVLHVREDGQWKVAVAREWGGAVEKLDDLHWLIGKWTAKAKDRTMEMSFEWNASKTLIKNRFSVKNSSGAATAGTQIIGMDPQTGTLRSHLMEDDGGRGDSFWIRDGNHWVLNSVSITPDAVETSALNVITKINDDEFTWRSVHRTIGAMGVPDTTPVKISRVKG